VRKSTHGKGSKGAANRLLQAFLDPKSNKYCFFLWLREREKVLWESIFGFRLLCLPKCATFRHPPKTQIVMPQRNPCGASFRQIGSDILPLP